MLFWKKTDKTISKRPLSKKTLPFQLTPYFWAIFSWLPSLSKFQKQDLKLGGRKLCTVKDFRKYEKLEYKKNKLKLDIDFLNNCKRLGVFLKFLIFKLPNVSIKDALSIHKRLLCSAINKCNKDRRHLPKELSPSKTFLSTQLSTIDFYIITKSNII